MPIFFLMTLLCLVSSCGVKESPAPIAGSPNGVQSAPLSGIAVSKNGKFLLKTSPESIVVHPKFKIQYRIVQNSLEDLPSGAMLKVKYLMPDMPQMPVTPALVERKSQNVFDVTYDISMEGKWSFALDIEQGGVLLDTIEINYEVPAAL